MRLELADFPVTELRLGRALRFQAGVLDIDDRGLADLVRRDAQSRTLASSSSSRVIEFG